MAIKDWNGFKKSGDTYIPNDATARAGLQNKVDKVAGKGLSTNDYDDTEKAKVAAAFPRSEQAVLGAVNIMSYDAQSKTEAGMSYTVNADKTVTTSASEASTGVSSLNLNSNVIPAGTWKINGCPEGGSDGTWWAVIRKDNGSGDVLGVDTGSGITVTFAEPHAIQYRILRGSGQSAEKIFKPMISFNGGEYVAPAMTNRELTENNAVKELTITPATGITINDGSYAKIRNGILNAYISFKNESADISAFTQIASIAGVSGKRDYPMNFAGVNSSDGTFVPMYCPLNKSASGISIQSRVAITANKNVAVSITAILE